MIQRIQSLWLLLAAVAAALMFYLPFYSGNLQDGSLKTYDIKQYYLLLIAAALLVLLPAIAIFQFKKRSSQKTMIWTSIFLQLVFLVLLWMEVSKITGNTNFVNHGYKVAAVFPIVSIVFLVLAYNGIRHDERLLKEADRLR